MDTSRAAGLTQLMDSASRLAAVASESSLSDEGWTPSLMWWEPDGQATELKYKDFSLEQSIARLFSTRAAIIETLSQLTEDEWRASAPHDTFGTITITDLTEKILLHDEEHLESL